MPLNEDALVLDPGPRCVRDARRWAARSLERIDRDELLETAELGISELVGNAVLHARGPIRVRMRGTREHPRIEVFDGSHHPPSPPPRMTDVDALLTTVGRGLGIVVRCATAWGAEIERNGKVVWFEPALTMSDDADLEGDLYDPLDSALDLHEATVTDGVRVELRQLPVTEYADFQVHYQELRRELRLLALAHGATYPIATSLSRVFRSFDEDLQRARGIDTLDAVLDEPLGERPEFLDVTLVVPPACAHTAARMIDMLELADAFCRSERLLSLATTPRQREFQRWYLGEFVRQDRGEQAKPYASIPHSHATPGRP